MKTGRGIQRPGIGNTGDTGLTPLEFNVSNSIFQILRNDFSFLFILFFPSIQCSFYNDKYTMKTKKKKKGITTGSFEIYAKFQA